MGKSKKGFLLTLLGYKLLQVVTYNMNRLSTSLGYIVNNAVILYIMIVLLQM